MEDKRIIKSDLKIVTIFVASSIVDFKTDRDSLAHMFLALNNIMIYKNLYFKLILCEDLETHVEHTGIQKKYDDEIAKSDFCIILADKKIGEYTRHEFDVAYETYQSASTQPGSPLLYVYFKKNDNSVDPSLNIFKRYIESIQHYYDFFDSIESLKLKILLQINMIINGFVVDCSPTHITVNDSELLDTQEISFFKNNQKLKDLSEEIEKLKNEMEKATTDEDRYQINGAIQSCYAKIMEIQTNIVKIVLQVLNYDCFNVDEIEREKRHLIEEHLANGAYDEALKLIEDKKVNENINRIKLIISGHESSYDNDIKIIAFSINDYITKAMIYKQMDLLDKWELYLNLAYKCVIDFAKHFSKRYDYMGFFETIYEYGECLWKNRRIKESIGIFKEYLELIDTDNIPYTLLYKKANALRYIGVAYYDLLMYSESHEYLEDAVELYNKQVFINNNDTNRLLYSIAQRDLGTLFYFEEKYEIAQEKQQKAKKEQLLLVDKTKNKNFYNDVKELDAIQLREVSYRCLDYYHALAHTQSSLGDTILMKNIEETDLSDEIKKQVFDEYSDALKIREQLYHYSPQAYTIDLAWSYYDFGNYYFFTKDFDKSCIFFEKSVTEMQKLVCISKESNNTYLRRCLKGLKDAKLAKDGVEDTVIGNRIEELLKFESRIAPWEKIIPEAREALLKKMGQ